MEHARCPAAALQNQSLSRSLFGRTLLRRRIFRRRFRRLFRGGCFRRLTNALPLRRIRALALRLLCPLATHCDLLLTRRLPVHLFSTVLARRLFPAAALLMLALARNRHKPWPAPRRFLVRFATRSLGALRLRSSLRRLCCRLLRCRHETVRAQRPPARCAHADTTFTKSNAANRSLHRHSHSQPSSQMSGSCRSSLRPARA